MTAEETEATEETKEQEIFHLELHSWIDTQQTTHGVRHDDYGQYHAYCTRRLSRLSHFRDAKKHLICNAKYSSNTASSGSGRHAYCSRQEDTLNESVTHVPHVHILWYLLVLSERCWAHGNQLQKQKKRRQAVLSKYKKAMGWANQLLAKAKNCGDATTIQECQAYASWMTANYALEKLDYQTASQEYAKAMTLCHELSQTKTDDDDAKRLERQDLFMTRADTVLRPLFRYCQYELKQAGQPLMDEPRWQGSTTKATTPADEETSIVFRGQELVPESKELRVLLLKLQSLQDPNETDADAAADTKSEDETNFLNALSVLDDALEVVQTNLGTLEQAQAGPAVQAKRRQYLLWKGYLQSEKTHRVMDHTSRLLQSVTGHAERVHVYDALLQHAKSLLSLPRPGDDSTNTASDDHQEEDEFALQVQANLLRLRALKTYHMAWYYYQQPQNYQAAWALLQQSERLSKEAQEEIAACDEDMPHADEYMAELEALPLPSVRAAIQAAWHIQGTGGNTGTKGGLRTTNRPLWLRLDDRDAGSVLAGELLPMPLPCKPVFYDLAYDYAVDAGQNLDKIQDFVNEHTVQPEPIEDTANQSSSLLGWLTGSK